MGVDPFKATDTSETEKGSGGDLPVKETLTFTAPERKSRLGLDVRGMEKRESANSHGEFKVPRKSTMSVSASMDEDDKCCVSRIDDGADNTRPDIPAEGIEEIFKIWYCRRLVVSELHLWHSFLP